MQDQRNDDEEEKLLAEKKDLENKIKNMHGDKKSFLVLVQINFQLINIIMFCVKNVITYNRY